MIADRIIAFRGECTFKTESTLLSVTGSATLFKESVGTGRVVVSTTTVLPVESRMRCEKEYCEKKINTLHNNHTAYRFALINGYIHLI